MKIYFVPVILVLMLFADRVPAEESKFREIRRFIFHSIMEGLYEDGVSTEDVEQILMRREDERYFHFIYACPVCTTSIWAFDAYRLRPKSFYIVKSGDLSFGWGLGKKIRDDLHSDDVKRRLSAINTLIGRWIDRRMEKLRLTEEERAELLDELEGERELGFARLKQFRDAPSHAPAYAGQDDWECVVCNAVVGKPMHFGGKEAPEPDEKEPGKGGEDEPDAAKESELEASEKR